MTCDRHTHVFSLDAQGFAQFYAQHAQDNTALESMRGDTLVKPIFDVDKKLDQEPSFATAKGALLECKDKVADIFKVTPGFNADTQIALATRHGWIVEPSGARKFKLSFHAFVKGFALRLMDTRALIQTCGDDTYFDLSIYPKEATKQQLFTVVGGRKKAGDDRVMMPVGLEPEGPFALEDFLAQYLHGDEQMLTPKAVEIPEKALVCLTQACPEWDAVIPVLEKAGFTDPRSVLFYFQNNHAQFGACLWPDIVQVVIELPDVMSCYGFLTHMA